MLGLLTLPGSWASVSHRQGKVQVNGIAIAYESYGKEDHEAIPLIAGTGMQLTDWIPAFCKEFVRRGYRVIIYDNRDTGLSTKFDSAGKPDFAAVMEAIGSGKPAPLPYTLYDMGIDTVGLLDALGIRKAHIVGVSMGGMIAQIVATNYPDRTLSLTSMMATDGKPGLPIVAKPDRLATIPPPAPEGDRQAYIDRQVKAWEAIGSPSYPTEELIIRKRVTRDVARAYCHICDERQGAAALFTALEDRRSKLRGIHVPTLVIHGAEDPVVPVEAGQDVAANIPGEMLSLFPRTFAPLS
jgi:pimeloyl-ACP methyl ester carboxylesterase